MPTGDSIKFSATSAPGPPPLSPDDEARRPSQDGSAREAGSCQATEIEDRRQTVGGKHLLAAFERAQSAFDAADRELREWMSAHAVTINGQTCFQGNSISSGQQLGREYWTQFIARDRARTALQTAMRTWIEAKTGRSFHVGTQR